MSATSLHGDFGNSIYFSAPVTGLILERVPPTILLVGTALTFAVVAGSQLLGIFAAQRPTGLLSHVISTNSFANRIFGTGVLDRRYHSAAGLCLVASRCFRCRVWSILESLGACSRKA